MVDPEQRRAAIADALFAVVGETGFSGVTLANVADRAGLAIGSVRHFLGSREEMISFAFDTIADRFRDRILAGAEELRADLEHGRLDAGARLQATTDLLCEFLPLDETRRVESVVWLEFETAARTDDRLAVTARRATAETTRLIEVILEAVAQYGALGVEIDLDVESARLAALIDGLTLRSVLHPEILGPQSARDVLITHLRTIRNGAS